jgi:hypothetical protein
MTICEIEHMSNANESICSIWQFEENKTRSNKQQYPKTDRFRVLTPAGTAICFKRVPRKHFEPM